MQRHIDHFSQPPRGTYDSLRGTRPMANAVGYRQPLPITASKGCDRECGQPARAWSSIQNARQRRRLAGGLEVRAPFPAAQPGTQKPQNL